MSEAKPELRWYVVHTYSGFESKVKLALEDNIRRRGLQDLFGEILVPTEHIQETIAGGKSRVTKRAMIPSYILVQMAITDKSWHCVKDTPKVTGFIGDKTHPPSVPSSQVDALKSMIQVGDGKPRPRMSFDVGEQLRVTDGPFSGFVGTVAEVKADKAKVVVSVSIFGRATPIELDFAQVTKEV